MSTHPEVIRQQLTEDLLELIDEHGIAPILSALSSIHETLNLRADWLNEHSFRGTGDKHSQLAKLFESATSATLSIQYKP